MDGRHVSGPVGSKGAKVSVGSQNVSQSPLHKVTFNGTIKVDSRGM